MKTLRDYIDLIESNEQGVAEGVPQPGPSAAPTPVLIKQ